MPAEMFEDFRNASFPFIPHVAGFMSGRKCQPFLSRHEDPEISDPYGSSARDQAGKSTDRACGFYCNPNHMPILRRLLRPRRIVNVTSVLGSRDFVEPFG
jgi:hypothetical protein